MANIIVTGGGSGLGAKLATLYASEGHHIFLLGRRKDKLEEVKNQIIEKGGTADTFACDITQPEQIKTVIGPLIEQHEIDWLINNAGVGFFGPLTELTVEEINAMIDTNVKGTIFLTQFLLPHLLRRPEAKIMNIISTAGIRGKVNETVYCASKFAVRGFTESLVKELGNSNITVTAVYMGGMDTPFWDKTDHVKGKVESFKTPETVANMILSQDDGRPEIYIDK